MKYSDLSFKKEKARGGSILIIYIKYHSSSFLRYKITNQIFMFKFS